MSGVELGTFRSGNITAGLCKSLFQTGVQERQRRLSPALTFKALAGVHVSSCEGRASSGYPSSATSVMRGKENALESPEEGLCTHSCGAGLGGQGRWAGTEPHAWPSPRPRLPPTLGRWPAHTSHRTLPSEWFFSPTHWRVSISHRVPPVEPHLPAVSFPEGKARLLMAPGVGLSMLLFVSERGSHVSQAGL